MGQNDDLDLIDDLDSGSGPKQLRQHVKTLEQKLDENTSLLQQQADELARYRRRDAFEKAVGETKAEGLTLDDVADLPPDQITPELVELRAGKKAKERQQALEALAKQAGFDDYETFQRAMELAKPQLDAERQALGAQTQLAARGSSTPPPEANPQEKAWEAHKAALEAGMPADMARAEYVRALREANTQEVTPSAPAAAR